MKLLILLLLIISVKTFSQESISSNQENMKVDNIYDSVYPGGEYNFRQKFYEIFDRGKINGNGITQSEATFLVTSEGTITNIKATGINESMNKEIERVITEMSRLKWIPKKLNDKAINSKYRFPITITFAEDQ
ncbi:MAG: hypothetical protein DI622_07835 [Chryseobacterium sp.]|uniref:energy transducer TonB n=1 Tax=Chryseobacterium sp. TaxID=1871047 RepID=UPI000DB3CA38|nr:hypothetical protein [Chryseobacterium sp.]MPS63966.1 hypothetical protein [Chryseobacterium sp.]PZU20493.1 MAG: hypothetical protein DI622_07835 [Chryseobacterium sp.]